MMKIEDARTHLSNATVLIRIATGAPTPTDAIETLMLAAAIIASKYGLRDGMHDAVNQANAYLAQIQKRAGSRSPGGLIMPKLDG